MVRSEPRPFHGNRGRSGPGPPHCSPFPGWDSFQSNPLEFQEAYVSTSELEPRLRQDLTTARKARDKTRTLLLSTTLAEVKNAEIAGGAPLDDDGVVQVLTRAVKRRRDACEQMRAAGREELASREEWEAEALGEYLPKALTEAEVRQQIRTLVSDGASSMGDVMSRLMPILTGRFDGKQASRMVREELEA